MSLGAEKVIIRHSSTGRDNVGIIEIKKKKDAQFLVEKILVGVKKTNCHVLDKKTFHYLGN